MPNYRNERRPMFAQLGKHGRPNSPKFGRCRFEFSERGPRPQSKSAQFGPSLPKSGTKSTYIGLVGAEPNLDGHRLFWPWFDQIWPELGPESNNSCPESNFGPKLAGNRPEFARS